VAAQLADVVAGLNDVLRNLREYIAGEPRELRSGEQFRAELARLVEPAERGTAPRFEVDIDSAAFERLTPDEAQQLLSITREALSNALRHSRAKSGRVALRANAGDVELEVSDDGVGFDVEAMRREAGGLHNIASRAREIGARLEIHASPQEGSRITVTIPKQVRGHDRGRNN
jgi:signal transduction histidine kinase